MPKTIYYIAYASDIAFKARIKPTTLTIIKNQAHTKNSMTGITGFLFLKNRKFFQYFEGTKESCESLLQLLRKDIRHSNLTILSRGNRQNRKFQNWTMYCLNAKETTKDLDHRLDNFDIFNWKDQDIYCLVESMRSHCNSNPEYSLENNDLDRLYIDFTEQYKVFFIIQIGLLLASVWTILTLVLEAVFINRVKCKV